MILKLPGEIFVQTPSGVVRKDVSLAYDGAHERFGLRFATALHPDLASASFWLQQADLIDVKQSGMMRYKRLTIQLPQGDGSKDTLVRYDDERGFFGFTILHTQNPDLQKAVFWIRESDLVEVKTSGLASVRV